VRRVKQQLKQQMKRPLMFDRDCTLYCNAHKLNIMIHKRLAPWNVTTCTVEIA